MKRKTFFRHIFTKFVLIIVFTIISTLVYSVITIEDYVIKDSNTQLEQAAKTIVQFSNTYFNSVDIEYNQDTLVAEVKRKGKLFNLRFTLIDAFGNEIIDTKVDSVSMENYKNRPEIKMALKGDVGKSVRNSVVLGMKMAYIAVPLKRDGRTIGIVRASKKLSSLDNIVNDMKINLSIFGILVLLISLWVVYLITKHYASLLELLKKGAINFSNGKLESKLSIPNIDEMAYLAESMNDMALKLDERIRTIQKQSLEINARKEELVATFRSITDGVITFDLDGKVILMNYSAEKLLEWNRYELEKQVFDEYVKFYDESSMIVIDYVISKYLKNNQIDFISEPVVYISKYQRRFIFELLISPVSDNENNIIGGVLVIKDVTSDRDIEKELIKLKKLESVGRLAGGIAHDFNNLLAGILGGINLTIHSIGRENNVFKHLKIAEKACKRATDLTQKLLTFSKGGQPIKTNSKIGEIVKDSAEFVLHGSNIKLDIAIDDNLRIVNVDKGQISQVIQNLVINAIQAIDIQGEIKLSCKNRDIEDGEIVLVDDGKYIEIIIKDSGNGISKKQLEHIFDPYFTTKKEGNGLGLAVTYSIIKKHNGYIFVNSIEGVGTTFTILIPAILENESEDLFVEKIESGIQKELINIQSSNEEIVIAIMDDEELIRETSYEMLEMLNYKPELTKNSEQLFILLKEKHIDAVILDLTIPGGKGGKEIIDEIKDKYPNIKAIVSSGYSNDPVMSRFEDFNFDGVIKKPYSLDKLSDELNKIFYR